MAAPISNKVEVTGHDYYDDDQIQFVMMTMIPRQVTDDPTLLPGTPMPFNYINVPAYTAPVAQVITITALTDFEFKVTEADGSDLAEFIKPKVVGASPGATENIEVMPLNYSHAGRYFITSEIKKSGCSEIVDFAITVNIPPLVNFANTLETLGTAAATPIYDLLRSKKLLDPNPIIDEDLHSIIDF